jgi:hypothetical protein
VSHGEAVAKAKGITVCQPFGSDTSFLVELPMRLPRSAARLSYFHTPSLAAILRSWKKALDSYHARRAS